MLCSPSTFHHSCGMTSWHKCGTTFCRSHTLPKLAQNPMALKYQPNHTLCAYHHLQPYKRSACMVRNCGMVLICIRHALNVICSNQYPIKFALRGYRESPSIYFLFSMNFSKTITIWKNIYCGEDILPFLESFKMFNIVMDHTGTTALCTFHLAIG